MKNLFIAALMVVVSLSIKAQTLDVASVGNFISEETAQRWMQNFKSKFPNVSASQSIDQSVLRIMLTNDNTQGVYFYNAMNQDGTVTIIPMACDQETSLLTSTTTGIDQFHEAFPARAKAQLVGRNILASLLDLEGVASILVANAIDDEGQEKLVYVALDQNNLWISESGDGSLPCPPYCAKPSPTQSIAISMTQE